MAYVALFIILAMLEILSAILMYVFKDILHTVLALSALFIFNSAMFLILNQPFLALLQLFIMVGGVSTYIFVGVGSGGYSKFKNTNYKILAGVYVAIFLVFSIGLINVNPILSEQNSLTPSIIAQSLGQNVGLLYLIGLVLFGAGFGSIMLMRKLGDKK
jgi:NADH:ubiquinone oxidoreductase subunit 6 (subunit J)